MSTSCSAISSRKRCTSDGIIIPFGKHEPDKTKPLVIGCNFRNRLNDRLEKLLFEHPDSCVRIPMIDEARSLNLSNSVAVGVYEVLRQWGYPALSSAGRLRNYDWDASPYRQL